MEKINSQALVELFKNDFVVSANENKSTTTTSNTTSAPTAASPLVVITNNHLTDADTALLSNILKAIKIDIQQTPIVEATPFTELVAKHNPSNIISFGVSSFDLGIKEKQITLYTAEVYQNKQILIADPVSKIATSPDKKQALWLNLKKMFNV